MSNRENLFQISELKIAQQLRHMSNSQLNNYINMLNSFVDELPALDEKLKGFMAARDIKSVFECLYEITQILKKIKADELVTECFKRTNALRNKPERMEAFIIYFLSTLASLSIDIQMALFKDENDEDGDSADDSVSASAPETVKSILSEPAPASESAKSTLSESTSASETAKSILAVDDDVYCIDMFKAALQSIPCKIIGATSGKSALNILKMHKMHKIHPPDLFVLDIEMPEMNGYQLARELRANGQKSPIVFITGNSTNDCILQALKIGAADFIVKPINPSLVLARIGKFL